MRDEIGNAQRLDRTHQARRIRHPGPVAMKGHDVHRSGPPDMPARVVVALADLENDQVGIGLVRRQPLRRHQERGGGFRPGLGFGPARRQEQWRDRERKECGWPHGVAPLSARGWPRVEHLRPEGQRVCSSPEMIHHKASHCSQGAEPRRTPGCPAGRCDSSSPLCRRERRRPR